ncbi:TPA: hypothetical protein P0E26_004996 [Vibrio harveyi]|nr:hypothetical protein [Vibrio harveyi]
MSLDIIVYIFSGGVGGGIVSFLLKSWFETRLKNSIKHEYDKRLLELKASIDKESSLLSMLQANYSHKNNLSHERTLNAIESLWAGILVIRELKPSILTVVDVLVEKEFGTDFGTNNNNNVVDIKESDIAALFSEELNRQSSNRLYAGDYLWSLFAGYRQLVGRISYVIKSGRENKNVPIWWEDKLCKNLISSLCSKDELDEFNGLKFQRIAWVLNLIEHKYLQAANKIITGEASIDLEADLSSKLNKVIIERSLMGKNL